MMSQKKSYCLISSHIFPILLDGKSMTIKTLESKNISNNISKPIASCRFSPETTYWRTAQSTRSAEEPEEPEEPVEPLPAKRRGAAKKARAECGQWDSEKKTGKMLS